MTVLSNTRTKLIWEPGQPWVLHVDNQPVGAWSEACAWERGLHGVANGETYRIDVLTR